MADLKSVGVRLYALNADYKKSMKESGDATQSFGKVSGVALAAVGTAAAAFALKAADSYVAYGKTIMGLARISGESVETMSKLNFAAQQTGVSSETLAAGIKFLQKNMASGNAEFEKLNVTTKNADGSYRNVHAVFLDTADAISKMSNATEKADAIRQIFGRNGQALGALLNKGRDGIIALEGAAQKYGLVLTQDNIPAIQANIKAHREMDAAMQGAQNQIGQNVLPVLTSAINLFSNLPGPIASSIAPLAGVTGGVILLSKATAMLGVSLGPIGALIALVGGGIVLTKNRLDEGTKSVDALVASANKSFEGAKALEDLDRMIGQTAKSAKALRDDAGSWTWNPLDIGEKNDLNNAAIGLDKVTISQRILREAVVQYAAAHHVSTDEAIKALGAERDKKKALDEHADAAQQTAEEVKALTEANKAENDALRASMDPQFAVIDSIKKLGDAKQKNTEQEWAVVAAQNNYNQAVLIYGANSAAALDALWKLNDAKAAQQTTTNDLAKANLDLDVAVNNLTTSVKTNPAAFNEAKATLETWVSQGRLTRDQADKIAWSLIQAKAQADNLNGTQVVLSVQAQGLHDALQGFRDLSQFTGAKINTGWKIGDIGSMLGGARASGGPVTGGTPYLVGEKGPELFTPGASGNITANGRFEDGSRYGMSAAEKAALAYVKSIQKQDAMRAHPELQGRPGWGSLAANPFAGWAADADFSQWGKAVTARPSTSSSAGAVYHNTYNVTVQAPFGVNVSDVTRNLSRSLADLENSQRRR